MVLVIIHPFPSIPIFVFHRGTLSPFLMFDIFRVILVMILGDGDAAAEAR